MSIGILAASSYTWYVTKSFYGEIRSKFVLTINVEADVIENSNSIDGIERKVFDEDVNNRSDHENAEYFYSTRTVPITNERAC